MSYESENNDILFLLLFHVLKFKIYLRIITYTLITWYVSNLAIFWLCDQDLYVCASVPQGTNHACVSVFPHTSWVHAKCGGQSSQTSRVYAHTCNLTPSVNSMSPVTRCCVQSYCAYKYYMNFWTYFILICESLHNFFQINRSINLEEPIHKFARLEFHKF